MTKMTTGFIELRGEPVAATGLRLPKAQALSRLLAGDSQYPFVQMVECRAIQTSPENASSVYQEIVVFDASIEVPQKRVHDIRPFERIATVFREDDLLPPAALAVRRDFPTDVPHLNISPWQYPPWLCLSDQPWDEDQLRWTARGFVEQIRWWLSLTAEGRLHQEDQPLEPLLAGIEASIVLPHDLFQQEGDVPERLHCYLTGGHEMEDTHVVVAARQGGQTNHEASRFVAVPLGFTPPVTHGVMRWQPTNLKALHEFLNPVGLDVLEVLRKRLRHWQSDRSLLALIPIFVVGIPKRRHGKSGAESFDLWAFVCDKTLGEVGESIGTLQKYEKSYGLVLAPSPELQGESSTLSLMRPYFSFDQEEARRSNGLPKQVDKQIVAVGAGALGSQIFNNLIRSGFGRWTLVDDDSLLPHNLARHALDATAIGHPKALSLAVRASHLIGEIDAVGSVVTNVLHPKKNDEQWKAALQNGEVLLDLSASVAVARHLGRDLAAGVRARRISAFLTPSGNDLVVLSEDSDRKIQLDSLEMQYYRAVATSPELMGHLRLGDGKRRYGQSCRDLSQIMSQEAIALHAAIGSRAIRQTISDSDAASIRIWCSQEDLTVKKVTVPTYPSFEFITTDGWTLSTDAYLLEKVRCLRAKKLPVETGGVLVGSVDTQRKIIYVVDVLPSPPDSVESRTGYVRGSEGLKAAIQAVGDATAGWLEYIGEWHSHPQGYSANPSHDDRVLFEWLGEHLTVEDHPPVMFIVGEDQQWYVDAM